MNHTPTHHDTAADFMSTQSRPPSKSFLYLLLLVFAAIWLARLILPKRSILSGTSPVLWSKYDWPIVGSSLRFYGKRRDMVVEGTSASPSGIFAFYIGNKHVVNLGGLEGRRTFFDNKEFSVSQGFVELLTGLVSSHDARDDYGAAFFVKCIASLSRAEKVALRLPVMVFDTQSFCDALASQPVSVANPQWQVTDVTQSLYLLLYKLVHRSVGITEFAEDDKLLRGTLRMFETFESSTSLAHIIFPWLMTPNYVRRGISGARLYFAISKVLKRRLRLGIREEDAIQYVFDQEGETDKVVRFIFSALSSSVTMTGAALTWLVIYLADCPKWRRKCQNEVDAVVSRYRSSPTQSANEVLGRLSLQAWETQFPILYQCLQETLRLTSTGTFFRKNASGIDIAIGDSGLVVPNGSYAAYLPDNVHMDSKLYPDPLKFDPSRFSTPIRQDNAHRPPHTFLGWGSGRHLCAGMRLAKLEVNLVVVHLLSKFDFELADRNGLQTSTLPVLDRNNIRPEKPHQAAYIRYRARNIVMG